MLNQIRNDIEKVIDNEYDYSNTNLKSKLETLLLNYGLEDYKVVCDNTNNLPNIDDLVNVAVYIKPSISSGYMVNNITITRDERKQARLELRKLRKEKLNKIYETQTD